MSQEDIRGIIIELQGKPIAADLIRARLRARGIKMNEKSFYAALKKVEKDDDIITEQKVYRRFINGRTIKFIKRVWRYEPNNSET